MDIPHSLANLAGRLLKPFRAGDDQLAGREQPAVAPLHVESPSFPEGGPLPQAFAGANGRSPALRWSGLPDGTEEVAILCEDPDAPLPRPFVHWIVYGIGPDVSELPEGLPPTQVPLASGVQQGSSSMGGDGYTGPAPPRGHGVHHYHFQVFALDRRLDVTAPVDRDQIVDAMRGHVLTWGETVATYERS